MTSKMSIRKIIVIFSLLIGALPLQAVTINYSSDPDECLSIYNTTISEDELPDISSGQKTLCLRFPVYEPVKAQGELGWLKKADLPQYPVLDVRVGMERKKECWDVSFCPYVKRGGRFFRLVSFEWGFQEELKAVTKSLDVPSYSNTTKAVNDPSRYAAHSLLAQGNWLKISVSSTGIYTISYKDLEKKGIDPGKAQIYGYGGRMLKEDFSKAYTDDLPEVPSYRDDDNSRLVFYGVGPCNWTYSSNKSVFVRENNPYSTKGYYFIGERAEGTLTVETISSTATPTVESSAYTDLQLHEKDLYNLGKTGRECYGEDFVTSATQKFTFNTDHAMKGEQSRVLIDFAARSTSSSSLRVYLNDENFATVTISSISADNNYTYANAVQSLRTFNASPDNSELNITLAYQSNGGTVKAAHLNYIIANIRKELYMTDKVLLFRDPSSVKAGATCKYTLSGADASTIVLDVTDPQSVRQVKGNYSNNQFIFQADCSILHEYAAIKLGSKLSEATIEGNVESQDLHGLPQPQMVIITPNEFIGQAHRLAEAHNSYDGLKVAVVTDEQIYNEFSSGTPDATAYRRFMKMFYDRAKNDIEMPQSLLLFGDGVYDNRLVTNTFKYISNKPNKLLTYESEESLEGTTSFVSDDYFGFLDDTEGVNLATDKLDIGVGRFPVATAEQASMAVDKALYYLKNGDKGTWKNTLCFMADDGDNNTHVSHANTLADQVTSQHPEFIVNKIYVDAFNRVSTVSGSTTPDANKRFMSLLTSGLLMLNYSGHGSTTAWTAEGLLTYQDIQQMRNTRLPLWVTATCDFCRYDDSEDSGGETVFRNPNGGAIALITTSRIVYSGPNFTLNKAVISNIFNRSGNKRLTLGEVMRQTKRSSALQSDRNKLSFALIGDPALKLGYPEYHAVVTSINGHKVDVEHPDTAKAMSRVSIEGEILNTEKSIATDFNGTIYPTVFDASVTAQTLGNNGNDVFTYKDRSNILYAGKATVKNGRFSFSFIVPNDQSYSYTSGLINLYASTEKSPVDDNAAIEAQGVFEDFILGGTLSEAQADTVGPLINLYLNDLSFRDGDCVNSSPTLIANLNDTSGLNTSSSGIGHDIVLTLDGNEHYTLNSNFESTVNSCTGGSVYYNLSNLSEGSHTLTLKAWDMQNNSSTKTISFRVEAGQKPTVEDLQFYQTPSKAWFNFTHNRPQGWLSVRMTVYDPVGRLVWQSDTEMYNRTNTSENIEWDYTGEGGRKVGNGVYICRLSVDDGSGAQCVSSKKILLSTQ